VNGDRTKHTVLASRPEQRGRSLRAASDDVEAHLGRVGGLHLVVDPVQQPPEPLLRRRVQDLGSYPRRRRRPVYFFPGGNALLAQIEATNPSAKHQPHCLRTARPPENAAHQLMPSKTKALLYF
jgi:hypothetical protein